MIWAAHHVVSSRTKDDYASRYLIFTRSLGRTLTQMERNTESLMLNAARLVDEEERRRGQLSNKQLKDLAAQFSVTHIFEIDHDGRFIRSTNEDPRQIPNAFSFCPEYREFMKSSLAQMRTTPIIPPRPEPTPYKFLFIMNYSYQRMIEVGVRVGFLAKTLSDAIKDDPNVVAINLYATDGTPIGSFGKNGADPQNIKATMPDVLGSILDEPQQLRALLRVESTQTRCCQCDVAGISKNGEYYYIFESVISKSELRTVLASITQLFLVLQGIAFILALIVAKLIADRLSKKIQLVAKKIQNMGHDDGTKERINLAGNDEIALLTSEFDSLLSRLDASKQELLMAQRSQALAEVASQVAHDIRSPLAALSTVESDFSTLEEGKRILVRGALNRIRDIANNLLYYGRSDQADSGPVSTRHTSAELLPSLIESIVSEKRIRFCANAKIRLELAVSDVQYGLFAQVHAGEFKRAISNLLENALEAIGDSGDATIQVFGTADHIEIVIRDSGAGIPPDILAKIGERGLTHGKAGGSGLGVFQAMRAIRSWNGNLTISSAIGQGAQIRIELPRAQPPPWFKTKVSIEPGSTVVISDDDDSIHQVWRQRFKHLVADQKITLVHHKSPAETRSWLNERKDASPTIYLVDYEFIGCEETGLSLITSRGLAEESSLVTSRYEEFRLQQHCLQDGVQLIPKSLAVSIPVVVSDIRIRLDAVLLDDDQLIHMSWRAVAQENKKSLECFYRPQEFLLALQTLDVRTPIFIDSNLGDGVKGESLLSKVRALGFKKVSIASGYDSENFFHLDDRCAIVGKEPPREICG